MSERAKIATGLFLEHFTTFLAMKVGGVIKSSHLFNSDIKICDWLSLKKQQNQDTYAVFFKLLEGMEGHGLAWDCPKTISTMKYFSPMPMWFLQITFIYNHPIEGPF